MLLSFLKKFGTPARGSVSRDGVILRIYLMFNLSKYCDIIKRKRLISVGNKSPQTANTMQSKTVLERAAGRPPRYKYGNIKEGKTSSFFGSS